MKVVIAPDSFKQSLSAQAAARAIAAGFQQVFPEAELLSIPLADGGEGSMQTLVDATGGSLVSCPTVNAHGESLSSHFGLLGDGETAVVEFAAASGLHTLTGETRDPWTASSRGTGQLLRAAFESSASQIILCLGGSATVDGGLGALSELGFRFLDAQGHIVPDGARGLQRLAHIDSSAVALPPKPIRIAADVDHVLLDAAVFAEQKGLHSDDLPELSQALKNFARHLDAQTQSTLSKEPGTGAAGASGAGFAGLLGGSLEPGFNVLADAVKLETRLQDADLVITGEGEINHQTAHGKVPSGVAHLARAHGIPVIAVCGALQEEGSQLFDACFSCVMRAATLDTCLKQAEQWLTQLSLHIAKTLKLGKDL